MKGDQETGLWGGRSLESKCKYRHKIPVIYHLKVLSSLIHSGSLKYGILTAKLMIPRSEMTEIHSTTYFGTRNWCGQDWPIFLLQAFLQNRPKFLHKSILPPEGEDFVMGQWACTKLEGKWFLYLFVKPLDGVKAIQVPATFSPLLFRFKSNYFLDLLSLEHSHVIYLG